MEDFARESMNKVGILGNFGDSKTENINLFANHCGWSDVHPFEVIKVNTSRKLTIRSMDAELDKDWKPETVVGGFCGHTVNNHSQNWNITSDENGNVIVIRLSKNKGWQDKHGRQYRINDRPVKFYDYNF